MTDYATRDEVQHLTTRVDVLEREVEGEKTVTRYILEQTRRNGDDLVAIRSRLDRVEGKVDGLDKRFDLLDRKVDGLARSLPGIVAGAVREAFRERDRG